MLLPSENMEELRMWICKFNVSAKPFELLEFSLDVIAFPMKNVITLKQWNHSESFQRNGLIWMSYDLTMNETFNNGRFRCNICYNKISCNSSNPIGTNGFCMLSTCKTYGRVLWCLIIHYLFQLS